MTIELSVIICAKKLSSVVLEDALESVGRRVEHIIVCAEVDVQLEATEFLRIYEYSCIGPGAKRLVGARHAHGKYIIFRDDSDILMLDKIILGIERLSSPDIYYWNGINKFKSRQEHRNCIALDDITQLLEIYTSSPNGRLFFTGGFAFKHSLLQHHNIDPRCLHGIVSHEDRYVEYLIVKGASSFAYENASYTILDRTDRHSLRNSAQWIKAYSRMRISILMMRQLERSLYPKAITFFLLHSVSFIYHWLRND